MSAKYHCDQCDAVIRTSDLQERQTVGPAKPAVGNFVLRLQVYQGSGNALDLCQNCRHNLARIAGADLESVL